MKIMLAFILFIVGCKIERGELRLKDTTAIYQHVKLSIRPGFYLDSSTFVFIAPISNDSNMTWEVDKPKPLFGLVLNDSPIYQYRFQKPAGLWWFVVDSAKIITVTKRNNSIY